MTPEELAGYGWDEPPSPPAFRPPEWPSSITPEDVELMTVRPAAAQRFAELRDVGPEQAEADMRTFLAKAAEKRIMCWRRPGRLSAWLIHWKQKGGKDTHVIIFTKTEIETYDLSRATRRAAQRPWRTRQEQ